MNALKNIVTLAFCFVVLSSLSAQSNNSYDAMQTRFEKKTLGSADSAAFIQTGVQKAKTLFEYNDVYLQNSTIPANQKYVEKKVPELFFIAEGDSLDINQVMQKAQAIVRKQMGKPVELKHKPKDGFLGQVYTLNTEPVFMADLILVKVDKPFGKTTRQVWQVYLTNPVFEE